MSQENFMLGASEKFIVHLLSDLKKITDRNNLKILILDLISIKIKSVK